MANPTIRGRAAVWGIATESGDTYAAGIIQRQGREDTGEEDYIYDNAGFTISEIFFDNRNECDIDILCEAATAAPARGADIQLVGLVCIVQGVSTKWEKKGWKMMTVRAKKFVNLVE